MNKKNIFLILLLLLIVGFSLSSNISNRFSALEIDKNTTRQEYLGNGLGKLYKNRIGVYYFTKIYPKFFKIEQNFFLLFNSPLIYMTIFGSTAYFGWKNKYEK